MSVFSLRLDRTALREALAEGNNYASGDRNDEIVAFYDDYASGDGWRREALGQSEPRTIDYMNLMDGLNVSVDPPIGDSLIVTLTVS